MEVNEVINLHEMNQSQRIDQYKKDHNQSCHSILTSVKVVNSLPYFALIWHLDLQTLDIKKKNSRTCKFYLNIVGPTVICKKKNITIQYSCKLKCKLSRIWKMHWRPLSLHYTERVQQQSTSIETKIDWNWSKIAARKWHANLMSTKEFSYMRMIINMICQVKESQVLWSEKLVQIF